MDLTHFLLALSTGLFGSGHCIGMCGGLVTAFSLAPHGRQGGLPFQVLYHLGRVATYTLIGAAVGWLGSALVFADNFREISRAVLIGSDLFIMVIGLGTAGAFTTLNIMRLEFHGCASLFTRGTRFLRTLSPPLSALPLGLLMGLLPCGFLYAIAITAAQTASPAAGALTLLGFGLGTTPSLLLFGRLTGWMGGKARSWMLRIAGVLVAVMGLLSLIKHLGQLA